MNIRRPFVTQLSTAFVVCVLSVPARAEIPRVAVELECHASADAVDLRITLPNVGATDTAVVLGNSIGNGSRYFADSLALDVKRNGSSAPERFQYSDPSGPAAVAGRVDPWIVPLPAASKYSLTRPIDHFWSDGKRLTRSWEPMELRIYFNARADQRSFGKDVAGEALVNVVVGQFTSEWRRVPTDCVVG